MSVKSSVYKSPSRLGILILTLLALAMGGATVLWEQALLALLGAILLLAAPTCRSIGRWPNVLLPALLVLALAAFLPAAWAPAPLWRQHLTGLAASVQTTLPGSRTPQPWLTIQACCLLFVGLVWAYYVLSQIWNEKMRLQAVRVLVLGVGLLAAVAVVAFCTGFHVPNWDQEENRGWFPNRNQTADVLAICGVINYALIYDCLRKGRLSGYLWAATIALIGAALVVSYSRSGIVMFFGGIILWHLWPVHRRRKNPYTVKWLTLSLALVFTLLTLFFLFGGDTLARFEGQPRDSVHDAHYRVAIQKDALRFSLQSPFLGVGLGNFEPLFASYRQESANANRAIHPESDWLWAACELGWLGPLIFLAGIIWWLKRCLPFESKPGESLRRACTIAGILFVLHGLVDVSGHRVGSFWVGILVASLAIPDWKARPRTPGMPVLFRVLALAVLLVGGWWTASVTGVAVPPTTATLEQLSALRDQAIATNQLVPARDIATEALRISPLDWHVYYQRAYAETFLPGQLAQAGADFLMARNLQSKWVKPCFDEGATWLAAGQPDLCENAWAEALRRASPLEINDLYKEMVVLARANDQVHAALMDLASGNIDFQLTFLGYTTPDEAKTIIGDILATDPELKTLDPVRRERLFAQWWEHGDKDDLMAHLTAHPDWLTTGWKYVAESYAAKKDFKDAWAVVAHYSPQPIVPTPPANLSVADLKHQFYELVDDLPSGIMLALAEIKAGQNDDALATVHALEKIKGCPKYIYYIEATLWAGKQQWDMAWTAWWNFQET